MNNILIAIPQLEVHRPPISTAVIASVIRSAGFELKVFDLNIKLFQQLGDSAYYDLSSVWEKVRKPTDQETKQLEKFIDNELLPHCDDNTRLMISVFTSNSHVFAKMCCERVLSRYPTCEIVLGGMGVDYIGQIMLDAGLCKYVIFGEGEQAIIELLNGNTDYPGINKENQIQVNNLNDISFPVYDDYDISAYDYLYKGLSEVNIVGSRGCVRKCTYCDVQAYWSKFR